MTTHQLENGYTKIADTLLEALPLAGLSKREMQVVLVIIRRAYGFNQPDALISYSFLEAATGISRRHCISTVNALVKKGAIRRHSSHRGSVLSIIKEWFEIVPKIGTIPSAQNGHPQVVPKIGTEVVPKTVHEVVPKTAPNKEISTKTSTKKKKRARRWGDDEKVPIAWIDWASDGTGLTQIQAGQQALVFCDYWRAKAGSGAVKLDWYATWRNWIRRHASEFSPTRSNGNGRTNGRPETPSEARDRYWRDQAALAGIGPGAAGPGDGVAVDVHGGVVWDGDLD